MNNIIFESDRYFQLHDYYLSHGQLLIRARANQDHKTNIDVIFFDTFYTQIISNLKGIRIKIVESIEIDHAEVSKFLDHKEHHLFEVECQNDKYYIAAAFFNVYENSLGINETSLGRTGAGREKIVASSHN